MSSSPGSAAAAPRTPVVAIVGRPNVGKSTLFNRMTRSRAAIVHDRPGLTRDRHYGRGRVGEHPFIVIDTGGFEPVAKRGIEVEMARQARQAVLESDVVVFVVDGRQGLTGHDREIAVELRRSGRPVLLAVNKWDAVDEEHRDDVKRDLDRKLYFLAFARLHYAHVLAPPIGEASAIDEDADPREIACCADRATFERVRVAFTGAVFFTAAFFAAGLARAVAVVFFAATGLRGV